MNATAHQPTASNGSSPCNTMTVRLSVLCPLESGGTVVNVFLLKAKASMDWFRSHADELAATVLPNSGYTALNLEVVE